MRGNIVRDAASSIPALVSGLNQQNFGCIFSNSKFFKFLVMNYETHSSQMCRRLEIILSLSFQPCNFIHIWKLMIWMCRETPWPPPRGNRVNRTLAKSWLARNESYTPTKKYPASKQKFDGFCQIFQSNCATEKVYTSLESPNIQLFGRLKT